MWPYSVLLAFRFCLIFEIFLKKLTSLISVPCICDKCMQDEEVKRTFFGANFSSKLGHFHICFFENTSSFLIFHNCIHTYLYPCILVCVYDFILVWWHAHLLTLVASLHICILGNLHTLNLPCVHSCILARSCGIPVGRRSGGQLAMTLVATINVIIFFFLFLLRRLLFS